MEEKELNTAILNILPLLIGYIVNGNITLITHLLGLFILLKVSVVQIQLASLETPDANIDELESID